MVEQEAGTSELSSSQNTGLEMTNINPDIPQRTKPQRNESESDNGEAFHFFKYSSKPILRKVSLEIMMMFYLLGSTFHKHAEQFILDKKVCDDPVLINPECIGTISLIDLISVILTLVFGLIGVFVVGQFMGRYGFKKPLLIIILLVLLSAVLQACTLAFESLSINFNFGAALLRIITGERFLIPGVVYMNIALTVPPSKVAMRILVVTLFSLPVALLSNLSISYSHQLPIALLSISFVLYLVSVVILLVFFDDLEDNLTVSRRSDTTGNPLLNSVKGLIILVSKARPKSELLLILLLIVCCIFASVGCGYNDDGLIIMYLFHLSNGISSAYQAAHTIWTIPSLLSVAIVTIVADKAKFHYMVPVALGSLSYVFKCILLALLPFWPSIALLQLIVGSLSPLVLIFLKASILTLVKNDAIPAVIALVALLVSIEEIVATIAYLVRMLIFAATVNTFPGIVFLLTAVIHIILVGLAIICWKISLRSRNEASRRQSP